MGRRIYSALAVSAMLSGHMLLNSVSDVDLSMLPTAPSSAVTAFQKISSDPIRGWETLVGTKPERHMT